MFRSPVRDQHAADVKRNVLNLPGHTAMQHSDTHYDARFCHMRQ